MNENLGYDNEVMEIIKFQQRTMNAEINEEFPSRNAMASEIGVLRHSLEKSRDYERSLRAEVKDIRKKNSMLNSKINKLEAIINNTIRNRIRALIDNLFGRIGYTRL